LVALTLGGPSVPERIRWADGLTIKVPADIKHLVAQRSTEPAIQAAALQTAARDLRMRRAFLSAAPAVARLPISYRVVWAPLRRGIARVMGRVQRWRQNAWAQFPGWPIDLSADVIADLAGPDPARVSSPTPVLLTHDIDSPEGLRNLVDMFLPIEEAVGARSASYIVPHAWPLEMELISEVVARGHEIGVHGYDHSARTPFASPDERRARLAAGHDLGRQFGAVGYRAPSLVRTQALLDDLALLYRYDSSIPTSGGPFPTANNGCATARPWLIGNLWEIPLSLPRDGSLRFLGYSPSQITRMWLEIATLIARSGGVVNLLTHCERGFSGNRAMLEAYRQFIGEMATDSRFEFMLPRVLVQALDEGSRQWSRKP